MSTSSPSLLGIDIGGTKTAFVLACADGTMLDRKVIPSHAADGLDAMLARIVTIANEQIRDNPVTHVGVSVGGPVDASTGLVLGPPNLPGWTNVPLADHLTRSLGRPCRIEHDAKACTLAEWRFGAGRGVQNLLYLTLGTGLGAGIVIDGRLVRGGHEAAGEIGHWRIAHDGPMVYGKCGSLEGWASGSGLPRLARHLYPEIFGQLSSGEELHCSAEAGKAEAIETIRQSGMALGRALAMVIDLLAPERIILGSMARRLGDRFIKPLLEAAQKESLPASFARCEIVPAELGETIGDVAAICVAMQAMEDERHVA